MSAPRSTSPLLDIAPTLCRLHAAGERAATVERERTAAKRRLLITSWSAIVEISNPLCAEEPPISLLASGTYILGCGRLNDAFST